MKRKIVRTDNNYLIFCKIQPCCKWHETTKRTKEVKLHRVEYFYFDLSTFKDRFREIKREGEDKNIGKFSVKTIQLDRYYLHTLRPYSLNTIYEWDWSYSQNVMSRHYVHINAYICIILISMQRFASMDIDKIAHVQ